METPKVDIFINVVLVYMILVLVAAEDRFLRVLCMDSGTFIFFFKMCFYGNLLSSETR